ncbi:hypothetical protein ACJIZ3_025833 [Penstemon smallii]|uniref:Secreted protein n=1 Tax=Penstemon smallii TaxID=265156 RepID=A0ABD3TWP7_9LAMI
MFPLIFAVAFTAAPLTLYIPPIRSLNLFVEMTEFFLRDAVCCAVRICPRIFRAVSRLLSLPVPVPVPPTRCTILPCVM